MKFGSNLVLQQGMNVSDKERSLLLRTRTGGSGRKKGDSGNALAGIVHQIKLKEKLDCQNEHRQTICVFSNKPGKTA